MTDSNRYMTVGQLRAELARYPVGALVILSRDPEGNGYSPIIAPALGDTYYHDHEVYSEEDWEDYSPPHAPDKFEPNSVTIWPAY